MQIPTIENNTALRTENEIEDEMMDMAGISPAHTAILMTYQLTKLMEWSCQKISDHMDRRVRSCGGDSENDSLTSRVNQYVRSYF